MAPSFSLAKHVQSWRWFSGAFTEAIGGNADCAEGVSCHKRFRRRQFNSENRWKGKKVSVLMLKLVAMVLTAYAPLEMKGDRPERKGEDGDECRHYDSEVPWVKKCRGEGSSKTRAGSLMSDGVARGKGGCMVL